MRDALTAEFSTVPASQAVVASVLGTSNECAGQTCFEPEPGSLIHVADACAEAGYFHTQCASVTNFVTIYD